MKIRISSCKKVPFNDESCDAAFTFKGKQIRCSSSALEEHVKCIDENISIYNSNGFIQVLRLIHGQTIEIEESELHTLLEAATDLGAHRLSKEIAELIMAQKSPPARIDAYISYVYYALETVDESMLDWIMRTISSRHLLIILNMANHTAYNALVTFIQKREFMSAGHLFKMVYHSDLKLDKIDYSKITTNDIEEYVNPILARKIGIDGLKARIKEKYRAGRCCASKQQNIDAV